MIQHYYKQQELPAKERLTTPMFIQEQSLPYFAGQKTIPNLPSSVITPRTLGNQWMEQWKKFTQLGSFVPVRYSVESGTLESFCSDPTGPYRAAAGQDLEHAGQVVIIADLLAGISNAGSLFECALGGSLDKIHNLQNSSHTQQGVQLITQSLSLVIGATATPLFTLLKCLLALGRNLRYLPLLGEQGVQVWNKMQEMLSTDYLGRRILDLPFVQKFIAWAPMNEEEKEMQRVINQEHTQQKSKKTKLAQKAKAAKRQKRKQAQDNVGDNEDEDVDENAWNGSQAQGEVERSNCKNVRWHNFLIEQKFAGMLAKLGALRLEEQAQELDCDKARLVQEPLPSKKPRKFLIYVKFQQHQALIAKMLTLKEKDYVTYNSSMATTKRQRAVFGLGFELDQIMGRVDRPGQLQDVAVYNIMAPEGIDLALNVYADSKAQLSNHFLSLQRTLQTVYSEIAQPHSNDHNELDLEEIPAVPSTKGTKPSTSKLGHTREKPK
ncbi:hypothetical protein RHS01_08819 [Rhizoctonia solani]|uniref:Uncharacterized protein n=1 Tax=Rhizoctonia solani TaxID=456999 RepID=A0A8H7I4Z4_9AGAM|nr:hypothetical protein RHS01_08819 [Rhizoctonia solani]